MNDTDIPILKKSYDLYKLLYDCRKHVPKQDRYAMWQHCEVMTLAVIECLLSASQTPRKDKLPILEQASLKLNLLRVFVRLAKELHIIDSKKYVCIQVDIDEMGKMLGGWIRTTKE
jgi:hypothetical protein